MKCYHTLSSSSGEHLRQLRDEPLGVYHHKASAVNRVRTQLQSSRIIHYLVSLISKINSTSCIYARADRRPTCYCNLLACLRILRVRFHFALPRGARIAPLVSITEDILRTCGLYSLGMLYASCQHSHTSGSYRLNLSGS